MFLEARVAVHWLAFSWLKRNFAFLSAVSAHCLVHLAMAIVAAAASIVVGTVLVVVHSFTCFLMAFSGRCLPSLASRWELFDNGP